MPKFRAYVLVFVILQEWNEYPALDKFRLFSELWQLKVCDDLAHILLSKDISRDTRTPLPLRVMMARGAYLGIERPTPTVSRRGQNEEKRWMQPVR